MKIQILKALFRIWVLFLIVFEMSSCKLNADLKIGLLIPNSNVSSWAKDQKQIEDYAKGMGVSIISKSAENDENLQIQQSRELIDESVDVIVLIAVNQVTAATIVRDAHAAGIKVIAYGRIIKNCELDYLVVFKGEDIGKMMIDYALKSKPTGNYVLLYGDAMDVNAVVIRKSQEAALKDYVNNKSINILYEGFQDEWSKDFAYNNMSRVLNFSDKKIDAVIASYTELARAAIEAFENTGTPYKDSIIITAQDSELNPCRDILDGKISMLLYKPRKLLAKTTIDLAHKLAKNNRVTEVNGQVYNGRVDVPAVMLKPILIDKNTIKNVLTAEELKFIEQLGNTQ